MNPHQSSPKLQEKQNAEMARIQDNKALRSGSSILAADLGTKSASGIARELSTAESELLKRHTMQPAKYRYLETFDSFEALNAFRTEQGMSVSHDRSQEGVFKVSGYLV